MKTVLNTTLCSDKFCLAFHCPSTPEDIKEVTEEFNFLT